jgi:hypothetical protein
MATDEPRRGRDKFTAQLYRVSPRDAAAALGFHLWSQRRQSRRLAAQVVRGERKVKRERQGHVTVRESPIWIVNVYNIWNFLVL